MTSEEMIARQGEIEQRKAEIDAELEKPEADLDALNEEARKLAEESDQLKEQLEELRKQAEEAEEARKAVEDGAGETREEMKQEDKKMEVSEIRNSPEYLDAFANYIRTGSAEECRTVLLSKNAPASGQLPVPDMLEGIIKNDKVRCRKVLVHALSCLLAALELFRVSKEVASLDSVPVHSHGDAWELLLDLKWLVSVCSGTSVSSHLLEALGLALISS